MREKLAALAHESWSGWMEYLYKKSRLFDNGQVIIPPELGKRWMRQLTTPYADLPESEKESDRAEADKMLAVLQECEHDDTEKNTRSKGSYVYNSQWCRSCGALREVNTDTGMWDEWKLPSRLRQA